MPQDPSLGLTVPDQVTRHVRTQRLAQRITSATIREVNIDIMKI